MECHSIFDAARHVEVLGLRVNHSGFTAKLQVDG